VVGHTPRRSLELIGSNVGPRSVRLLLGVVRSSVGLSSGVVRTILFIYPIYIGILGGFLGR
jgi:hypothetical protein